jgi:methyl-accepting chemotaxis protein
VDEVNHLSQSFIDDTLHIIDIIGSYGQGDLSRDINRMPGKKVVAVNAVDTVKSNLLGVNAQIKELVDAALAGDFSLRGNANRFQFVYRELVEQLNQLMAISDKGLTEVGTLLTAIADGDLNKRINTQLPGQFGQLAADANQTASKLSDVVGGIRHAVDSINSAANEIATGNSDLSGRTEAQAASLEETAASMEELTATVRQNTENSREANGLAQDASNVAERGGVTVKQVVETMSKIQQASQRIGDIIGTIDSIAFQTNILALNAAVEAARAGEQGRGFAVVASEVRALAQRSADAAREIKILITDSVEQISEGANQVNTAGSTMQDIVGSIGSVSALMSEIYAASQEQSAGIEQVNLAITQMDEGTQQNAALVEEASAAAESLRQQAAALVQAVSIFH